MSNQPDFTQMTKEEVIAYFTSKMADEASNKAAEENRSGQVILSYLIFKTAAVTN